MNFKIFFMILMLIVTALVTFIHDSFSQSTSFDKHFISTDFEQGCEVCVSDLNKDGFNDIVGGGNGNNGQVVWWENTGYNSFIEHSVAENLQRVRSVASWDINQDGEMDIIAAAWEGNSISWFENDGEENWNIHVIDDNFIGAHTIDIADVDQDGKYDVLCSSFDNSSAFSEIAWYKNNLPDTVWTKEVISTRFKQSPFIHGDDMDGDGDIDILACGELNGEVYWWENDGMQNWTETMISDNFSMAHTVFMRHVDDDEHMDVVGAACMSSQVAWWKNDGNQNFTKQPLGSFAGALWLDMCDLDMDGDRDFYGGGQGATHLAWWENDGNHNFTRHDMEDIFTQTFCVVHGDLDNDGDPDLVATGYLSNQTSWFENNLFKSNKYDQPECIVYDQLLDRYVVANIGNGCLVETDTANNYSYWVSGYDNFFGMCIDGNVLYTSDGDTLLGFHLLTAEKVLSMPITNLNNLDGMTSDGNGFLYVIDTGGRLIKVDIANETWEVITDSGLPNWPQDCVYDPFENRIVIASYQASSPIVAADPETGELTTVCTNSVGNYDGITIDQYGNFYLATHAAGGLVYKYPHDFGNRSVIATGLGQPTGLNYNQYDNILAVPSFDLDTVFFLPITQTGMTDPIRGSSIDFELFPNPTNGKFGVRSSNLGLEEVKIDLLGIGGNAIEVLFEGIPQKENMQFNISHLPSGIYFTRITSNKKTAVKKLVVL